MAGVFAHHRGSCAQVRARHGTLRLLTFADEGGPTARRHRAHPALRSKIIHVAVVIENHGMLAQLLRTIIRTLNSVARSSRLSIANDLADAARAIAPHIKLSEFSSQQQIQQELLEAVATLRRALPAFDPQ